eukprot:XP_011663913.1 PREDICTED: zinc finger protein 91-like [Strongylocentrotus purpuratus]
MATDEGSNYTLLMNSDLASEEWELYEACGLSETTELPIESRAVIEDPLDCIPSITNPNSETQVVDAIGLDHVYQRNSSDAAPTVTECQPGLESPTCISLPELPKVSNPKPALDDPINRPVGSMSSSKSSSFLLDHTYSAQPSQKPPSKQQPSKKLPTCELCRPRTFFSNRLVLTEHYKWHLFEDANVGVQKPSIRGMKQTSEVDSQLHTMANVPKETCISRPVKPSTLCMQKVRKATQDTDGILQSSKKSVFDQLQQSQSTENIKQTGEKTDSQLLTTANVFDETTCLLKQLTESIGKTTEGTSQSLLLCDLLGPDKKHPVTCVYHTSINKTGLRDDDETHMLGNIFRCIWCKKFFSQFESFKQHKCKKKSGKANPCALINTYLCEFCGVSFARHGNFMKHIVLHNNVQAGNELKQTQSIVNIKQTSKNTDSLPHAIESVLQEPDVSPQKQSAPSLLKQSKEIIKQTSMRSDPRPHAIESVLQEPDVSPQKQSALSLLKQSKEIIRQTSLRSDSRPHAIESVLQEMQLDRCSPVLDSAATSDANPETSSSCNRTTPFQCSTCSKAFAFGSQLLRHENLHRLESRRPVPKRERSDSESGDESFGKVESGKKDSGGEERFGWKFRIKEPDGETGSGTRKRGTCGKGNQQEGPKSAPRWGGKARSKGLKVKHFFCRACDKGFYHPWQLRKHKALHTELSCNKCNGLVFSSSSKLNNHLFIGKHNDQVQSARQEKHGSEASSPQGNTEPSTPLESLQSGHPKGRMISSVATGLKSVQSGKSRTSSMSKKVDLASSGQSKGRTKTLSDKKMKSVQNGYRNGSNKSSKDKKIKSVQHGHSATKKEFSSRTKYSECSQSGQPNVSTAEPMVSAVGTKPIHCNQCGKGFLQLCKLNFHKLKCREFNCDKCDGLTFSSNAELKSHVLGHTNKFKCPKCGAQFASQRLLTNHTARHSDLVPNICDVCELAFNSLKALKMHKIMYHF